MFILYFHVCKFRKMNYLLSCCLLVVLTSFVVAQKSLSLEEKMHNLQESLFRRPVMRLNGDKFRTYVRSSPRNYSMIVMLTALTGNRGCQICRHAYDEYEIVANSYRYAFLQQKSMYFSMVDFDEGQDVFQLLNLNTAPVIIHFPPKGQRKKADTMDFQRVGFGADAIAKFVQDRTDIAIRVLRPPNYAAPAVVLLLAMLIGGLLYMRRNNLDFLYNRTSWGLICLCVIFAFMSGQMWNHIRGPPFIYTNPNNKETSFISGSSQMQFVAETYIVAALYAAVTAGFILMNDAADGKGDPSRRRIMAFVGLGMVVVFFSLLLSVFRSKYQGYPYSERSIVMCSIMDEMEAEEINVRSKSQDVKPILALDSSISRPRPVDQHFMGPRFWSSVLMLASVGLLTHMITRFLLPGTLTGPLGVILIIMITIYFLMWARLHGGGLQTRRRAYFDEANILNTYQTRAKTMGHLFKPEPPTPAEKTVEEEDEEIAGHSALTMITPDQFRVAFDKSTEDETSNKENQRKAFEEARRAHYGNEFMMARRMIKEQENMDMNDTDTNNTQKKSNGTHERPPNQDDKTDTDRKEQKKDK